jgi:hypothetical protein
LTDGELGAGELPLLVLGMLLELPLLGEVLLPVLVPVCPKLTAGRARGKPRIVAKINCLGLADVMVPFLLSIRVPRGTVVGAVDKRDVSALLLQKT